MENFVRTGYSIKVTADGAQQEFLHSSEEYRNSKLYSSSFYEKNGSIIEKTLYDYYENGRIKKTELYDNNNELAQKIEYLFHTEDDTDKVIEITYYLDESKDEYIEFYKDKLKSRTERYSGDILDEVEEYFYSDNKLIKYRKLDSNNNEIETTNHSYIDNSEIIELYSDGELQRKLTVTYDDGKIIEKSYDNGRYVSKQLFEYNTIGEVIEIISYEGSTLVGRVTYEYDENNNVIEECQEYLAMPQRQLVKTVSINKYDLNNRIIYKQKDGDLVRYEYS